MKEYENLARYLDALESGAVKGFFPLQLVAKHLGVSRAAVDQMLRAPDGRRKLDPVKVGNLRFVDAASLIALRKARAHDVAKVRQYLEKIARGGQRSVFYEPVMGVIGRTPKVPADRGYIGEILGEISSDTARESKTMLSVLVHRNTAGRTRPGPGFFSLADHLEFDWDDDDEFVEKQTDRVIARYRSARS